MITPEHVFWFGLGWLSGAVAMWTYFSKAKLIRSREEWEKTRKK